MDEFRPPSDSYFSLVKEILEDHLKTKQLHPDTQKLFREEIKRINEKLRK